MGTNPETFDDKDLASAIRDLTKEMREARRVGSEQVRTMLEQEMTEAREGLNHLRARHAEEVHNLKLAHLAEVERLKAELVALADKHDGEQLLRQVLELGVNDPGYMPHSLILYGSHTGKGFQGRIHGVFGEASADGYDTVTGLLKTLLTVAAQKANEQRARLDKKFPAKKED